MSGVNGSHQNQPPQPQTGDQRPDDFYEVPEGADYSVNPRYWANEGYEQTGEQQPPVWPGQLHNVPVESSHNQPSQREHRLKRLVAPLGTVARVLSAEAGDRRATKGETLRTREHLLHNAAYYRTGVLDKGERYNRPMPRNIQAAAVRTTYEWLASCYDPKHPARPEEARRGLEHIIALTPANVSPANLTDEQRREIEAARQYDWSDFIKPATVRALRERYLQFASAPETTGSNDPGIVQRMKELADQSIASGGLRGMVVHVGATDANAHRRPSVFVASFLGVKPDALEQQYRGEHFTVPPEILERIDFMLQLDARPLQMLQTDPETGQLKPESQKGTDHHVLDALFPPEGTTAREAALKAGRDFVNGRGDDPSDKGRMGYFERFGANGYLKPRPIPRQQADALYRRYRDQGNNREGQEVQLAEPRPIPEDLQQLARQRRGMISRYKRLRGLHQEQTPEALALVRDIRRFEDAAHMRHGFTPTPHG